MQGAQCTAAAAAVGAAVVNRAVVVGGGLGGLAAAVALRRAGIDAQVYEQRESIGGGAGTLILISPNGLYALSQIAPELVPQLIEAGAPGSVNVGLAPDGSVLRKSAWSDKFGLPFVSIAWSDVLDSLKSVLPPDCIHTGHTLVGLEQSEADVSATFKTADGGTMSVSAPLLVGSDGLRSETRRLLLGIDASSHLRDLGRTIWRTMLDFDAFQSPALERRHTYMMMQPSSVACLADAGSDRLYVAFTVLDQAVPGGVAQRSASGAEAVALLREVFSGVPMAQAALDLVEPGQLLERRLMEAPVLDTWHKGRVVLVGDAVHTMTPAIGQGANLAFEDAWELGEALQRESSLSSALMAFEAFRAPRAKLVAEMNSSRATAAYSALKPGSAGTPGQEEGSKDPNPEQGQVNRASEAVPTTDVIFSYKGHYKQLATSTA